MNAQPPHRAQRPGRWEKNIAEQRQGIRNYYNRFSESLQVQIRLQRHAQFRLPRTAQRLCAVQAEDVGEGARRRQRLPSTAQRSAGN